MELAFSMERSYSLIYCVIPNVKRTPCAYTVSFSYCVHSVIWSASIELDIQKSCGLEAPLGMVPMMPSYKPIASSQSVFVHGHKKLSKYDVRPYLAAVVGISVQQTLWMVGCVLHLLFSTGLLVFPCIFLEVSSRATCLTGFNRTQSSAPLFPSSEVFLRGAWPVTWGVVAKLEGTACNEWLTSLV